MPSSDPRFARLATDPRFIRPSKASQKIVLDDRFKGILHDEDEGDSSDKKGKGKAKVDKYGRNVRKDKQSRDMKAFYRLDEAKIKGMDRARGEGLVESSSEEEIDEDDEEEERAQFSPEDDVSSEDNNDEDIVLGAKSSQRRRRASSEISIDLDEDGPLASTSANAAAQVESAVPTMEEITNRVAIVNLDWDNVRAIDLYKVFDSVLSPTGSASLTNGSNAGSHKSITKIGKGRVESVKIYPSEFGKGRLKREEIEGPPLAVFSKANQQNGQKTQRKSSKKPTKPSDSEDEYTIEDLLQDDEGDEYDEVALRRYQLERLRYYYAVVQFDTRAAAQHAYEEIDGTEFEATANILDLRYVPDETTFDDQPTDSVMFGTLDLQAYKPLDFVTDALRNSKVKLTWDADDPQRAKLTREAYGLGNGKTKGKAAEQEVDYSALLASDSEDDAMHRDKLRAAFGLGAGGESDVSEDSDADRDNMEITFDPALSGAMPDDPDQEPDETTLEKYQRKERERRQAKKEKRKAEKRKLAGKGRVVVDDLEDSDPDEAFDANEGFENAEQGDSGDHDAFFETEMDGGTAQPDVPKLSKKAARQLEEEAKAKEAASLALLVNGDDDDESGDEGRHFDMHAVMRAEKISSKPKKVLKKGKDRRKHKEATEYLAKEADRFEVDVRDERFKGLHENHEFALDPTNPRFMKTKNMKRLLDESRKQRDVPSANASSDNASKQSVTTEPHSSAGPSAADLTSLVASIKRKSQQPSSRKTDNQPAGSRKKRKSS